VVATDNQLDLQPHIVFARLLIDPEKFPWYPIYSPGRVGLLQYKVSRRMDFRWHPAIYHQAIKDHRPSILHSHFGNMGWNDLPLVSKHGLKHVVTFYGMDIGMLPVQNPVWRTRYDELFSTADLFLCEGPYMANCIVNLGCPKEKVKVQRLGVALDQIAYIPRKLEDGSPLKVLIAGTFREKKGIPYALEAVGRLHKEGVDVQVTVIGDSRGYEQDEIEKQKILDVIEQFDMHAITRMLGFQPYANLIAEAFQHHVFLSPSVTASDGDTEGGAPIIEMAASGMPVVSTRHCDIPQVILDGRTGWLTKERDVEGLVSHLQWLIEHPHQWKVRTDQGRKHIEANFDVRIQAQSLGDKYLKLAGTR
jgi:colanic acid/amylovoran biosynthesis glycosyltransferase